MGSGETAGLCREDDYGYRNQREETWTGGQRGEA